MIRTNPEQPNAFLCHAFCIFNKRGMPSSICQVAPECSQVLPPCISTNPIWSKYLYIFIKKLAQHPLNHSHSLALGLGPWLAMYAQVSHASAIRSMRDGARGCLCRGTPLAIYDCSFRSPPESGFSAVPTSFVVRLPNSNIHQHRRLFIDSRSCQVISCQATPCIVK